MVEWTYTDHLYVCTVWYSGPTLATMYVCMYVCMYVLYGRMGVLWAAVMEGKSGCWEVSASVRSGVTEGVRWRPPRPRTDLYTWHDPCKYYHSYGQGLTSIMRESIGGRLHSCTSASNKIYFDQIHDAVRNDPGCSFLVWCFQNTEYIEYYAYDII